MIVNIDIPDRFALLLIRLLLLCRRLRFGYPFRRIPLTQGRYAIVDPDDYTALSQYNWRLCKTKGKNTAYAERSIRKPNLKRWSRVLMHRQIIPVPHPLVIDHINGDGLDNRKANLRPATIAQNAWNSRKKTNRSKFKGIWFAKDKNMYRAAIWTNGKRHYLGSFKTPTQAAKAYDDAAKKLHGHFARTNFK